MAVNPSIQLGTSGNWAIKEDNLLAYKQLGNKFFDREFDFSRGTRATFVGRNGLIQESGLTSAELVTNGNFSQEGSELVTNGDFETDTNWSKEAGWTISDGKANANVTGTQAIYQSGITLNKWYKVTYTISNYVSGDVRLRVGTTSIPTVRSSNGTFTEYLYATGTNQVRISPFTNGFNGSIDNVSVKEVGQDWTLGGSGSNTATIGSNSATITSVDGNSYLQQNSVLTSGKSYKISYEILSSSGSSVLKMISSLGLATVPTTVGTHTVYGTAISTTFYIERVANGINATITNISVKEIKTDVPRIDFTDDPTGHLLLEPQSMNLIPYSEDFSNSYWSKTGASVTSGFTSPDGSLSAYLFNINNPSGEDIVSRTFSFISGVKTNISIFVKDNDFGNQLILGISSNLVTITYDFLTQTILSSIGSWLDSVNITKGFNGFNRIDFTINPTFNSFAVFQIRTSDQGNGSFYIWGAQSEALSYATSYIPTSGSAVTRNQEICDNSGTVNDFNSEEGVLYANVSGLADDGTTRYIAISDGSNNERVQIIYSSISDNIAMSVVSSNTGQASTTAITSQIQYSKLAISYKVNNCSFWLNGFKIHTDTSAVMPSGLDVLEYQRPNNTSHFYGKVKDLKVFKRALTDAELYLLTVTQYQSYQEMATALNYTL